MSDYRVRNAISFLAWPDGSTAHYCVYNPSPHLFISLAIVYQPATDVTGITPHQVLLYCTHLVSNPLPLRAVGHIQNDHAT